MIVELKHDLQECMNFIREYKSASLFTLVVFIVLIVPIPVIFIILVIININLALLLLKLIIYVLLIELFWIWILDKFCSMRGKRYINKIIDICINREEYRGDGDEYSGVLIGNNLSKRKNNHTNAAACGLYFLNQYFKNNNKYCKIRQEVDKSDFDEFVLDPNCQELYILGHGSKKSFRMKNDTNNVDYSEYKGKIKHKKRIIAQLHCADSKIGDESLADILATDIDNSYVGCGYIFRIHIWHYCFKMWKNNRPKK